MTPPSQIACIGLGGNLGDRDRILNEAIAALADTPGLSLLATSSFHQTNPSGGPAGQGAYLNAAAVVETRLDPLALLHAMQVIENRAGRVRVERWGSRTLDLDLLLCGRSTSRTPELTLPHPLMAVRRFVLAPLAEVASDAIHPTTGRTVASLLANLDRRPSRVAIDETNPTRRAAIVAALDLPGWVHPTTPRSNLPSASGWATLGPIAPMACPRSTWRQTNPTRSRRSS